MMLALVLASIIATDAAVALIYLTVRRQLAAVQDMMALMSPATPSGGFSEIVERVQVQAEQATEEMGRQRTELRRVLTDLQQQQPARPAMTLVNEPAAISNTDHVLRLASQGMSLRGIAGSTGMSVEEVRLVLAMEGGAVSA